MSGGRESDGGVAQSPTLTRRSLLALVGGAGLLGAVGTAGCTAIDRGPVEVLPADRIVFGVSAAPGFAPPLFWALQAPSVLVYGSGLVVRIEDAAARSEIPRRATSRRTSIRRWSPASPPTRSAARRWRETSAIPRSPISARRGCGCTGPGPSSGCRSTRWPRRSTSTPRGRLAVTGDVCAPSSTMPTPWSAMPARRTCPREWSCSSSAWTRMRRPPTFAGRVRIPRSSSTVRGAGSRIDRLWRAHRKRGRHRLRRCAGERRAAVAGRRPDEGARGEPAPRRDRLLTQRPRRLSACRADRLTDSDSPEPEGTGDRPSTAG